MLMLACWACLALVPRAASSAPPPPAALVPPALATLDRRMARLRVSAERISRSGSIAEQGFHTDFVLSLPNGMGLSARSFTESGSLRFAPAEASLTGSFARTAVATRQLGGTTYVEVPPLARLDGGRPWVAEHPVSTITGASLLAPGAGGLGFPRLAALLGNAASVTQAGMTRVDGVTVERFAATLDPAGLTELAAREPGQSTARGRTGALELFLALSGRPVRIVIVERTPGSTTTLTTNLLALDPALPRVSPPAARLTISSSALERIKPGPL